MAYACVLRSQKDGKPYYGEGAIEEFATKMEARRRELFFKSIAGYNWVRRNKILRLDSDESGELAERLLHRS